MPASPTPEKEVLEAQFKLGPPVTHVKVYCIGLTWLRFQQDTIYKPQPSSHC